MDRRNFESLNKYEKTVLFIEMLEGEVNNGGFDQYFFNSSGEYAHETLDALERIKATKTADILNEAIRSFPLLPVPKCTGTRRELLEDLPESVSGKWEDLDDEFYEHSESLEGLIIDYVKRNKENFDL